jgi:hypothetical protein
MVAESVQSIYEARCSKLEKLRVSVSKADIGNGWVKDFESSLGEYKDGSCPDSPRVFSSYLQLVSLAWVINGECIPKMNLLRG